MRHVVIIPQNDDAGPEWQGGTPEEQGYHVLPLPNMRRPDAKDNEYYVYSSETEYKAVEANSAESAVMASKISDPYKVIHAHIRIKDILDTKALEYVGQNTGYMERHGFRGMAETTNSADLSSGAMSAAKSADLTSNNSEATIQ